MFINNLLNELHNMKYTKHEVSRNLTLINTNTFNGFDLLNPFNEPFILEYLERIDLVLYSCYTSSSRLFAIPLTLNFPSHWCINTRIEVDYFTRFCESLRAQLKNTWDKTEGERCL